MRPVAEQTILVTGATDGLGRAVASRLAAAGATVLVHGRDDDRGHATVAAIASATGNDRVRWCRADLASLADVDALAGRLLGELDRLDVLVNNAGVGSKLPGGGQRLESHDGIELRLAVNYLAHYLLTWRLMPLLCVSAPARVVNVSSRGQHPIDFDDPQLQTSYDGSRAYAQSKLAQILMTVDLAQEFAGCGVTVNALHPASYMPTKIVRAAVGTPESTLEEGVEATLRLITDPGLDDTSGRYFRGLEPETAHEQAYDPEARRRLRVLSDRLIDEALR